MKNTVVLMFSKDRAMQCDAALQSLKLNCVDLKEADVYVLVATTSQRHKNAYGVVVKHHPNVQFVPQNNFEKDISAILCLYKYVLFLVDDNIFTKKFVLCEGKVELGINKNKVLAFSYRLGKNIDFCYPLNIRQPQPKILPVLEPFVYMHEWSKAQFDWNYPMDVSSTLYRISTINHISGIFPSSVENPNELEYFLDKYKDVYSGQYPHLAYYGTSIAFCNPMNKVNPKNRNRSGNNNELSIEKLLELFENGYRMDVEDYVGFVPRSCHQEVDVVFKKQEHIDYGS